MKIRTRLLGGFATVMILVLGLAATSFQVIERLGSALDSAVNTTALKQRLVGNIRTGFQQMRAKGAQTEISLIASMVTKMGQDTGKEVATCASCHTENTVTIQTHQFEAVAASLANDVAQLRALTVNPSENQAVELIDQGSRRWLALYHKYLDLAARREFDAGHEVMLGQIYPLVESMEAAADRLGAQGQAAMAVARSDSHDRIAMSRKAIFVLVGACLLIGLCFHRVVIGVDRLLCRFAGRVLQASAEVAQGALQVSSCGQALAQAATEQTRSLADTASAIETIRGQAHGNAERADSATDLSCKVDSQLSAAETALEDMRKSMAAMKQSGDKVARILAVIDGIAFQTNILALNAAVESARAGAAGAGFAVVAEEVRTLAQRSAQAARETAGLIQESQEMSKSGGERLSAVCAAVQSMNSCAQKVKGLFGEVAQGSVHQAHGVDRISAAIRQMEQVTQQAASNAEENAAAGEELSAQSERLKSTVEQLSALI
ncbi:putative Methyl-accepting chemotaxis sensory transducer [Candidatus Sulfopaludibacter sp. SbA3]|nr:putative Methyl-accepting chemotaxis sensory transducer [Candidatus Sulfopaludibacter sp. SbA3]